MCVIYRIKCYMVPNMCSNFEFREWKLQSLLEGSLVSHAHVYYVPRDAHLSVGQLIAMRLYKMPKAAAVMPMD